MLLKFVMKNVLKEDGTTDFFTKKEGVAKKNVPIFNQ